MLETQASTKSNRCDTDVVVVKCTVHTELKEIRAKAMVITLANFDIGYLKKISERRRRKRKMNKSKV